MINDDVFVIEILREFLAVVRAIAQPTNQIYILNRAVPNFQGRFQGNRVNHAINLSQSTVPKYLNKISINLSYSDIRQRETIAIARISSQTDPILQPALTI